MATYSHNEEEDKIPALVPLRKKKVDNAPQVTPSQKNANASPDGLNIFLKQTGKLAQNSEGKNPAEKSQAPQKKEANSEKIQQFENKTKDKISTLQKKDNTWNRPDNEKSKENEKSKFLIAEMLNKISVKNLTEELYPVSNQVIEQLLSEIEKQITELHNQASKKQNTLAVNPNNLHLKKQLEIVQKQIGHCSTIKQLYYEKMNFRNKIQILEGQIIDLRSQNRDLKVKVSRGIQTIQNYKHNLPCDREKQLKEKLVITQENLKNEKQMRESLEKSIEGIIMNFKRLYDEADAARMIVTNKLREVEQRQRELKKMSIKSEQSQSDQPPKKVTSLDQISVSHLDSFNEVSGTLGNRKIHEQETTKKGYPKQKTGTTLGKEGKQARNESQPMTLEQKIRKMRNNQSALSRAGYS